MDTKKECRTHFIAANPQELTELQKIAKQMRAAVWSDPNDLEGTALALTPLENSTTYPRAIIAGPHTNWKQVWVY